MLKFIHAADVHLDSPLLRLETYEGVPAGEIRQASRRALENLIDLALDEAVDFVLVAGDLFDGSWKDYNTGLYLIGQVSRLKDAGIPLFLISGNHDAAGRMTRSLPYPDNVHHFSHIKPESITLENLNVAVHGQSFATPATLDNLALAYPDPIPGCFNIGLLHTSLTGREGHETYAPCSLQDLTNRDYDYWALGHVHQYEMVHEDPPVVFPGCLQGRHVRETGRKGCVLVTVVEGEAPRVVRHPLDVIRWERLPVDLEGAESEKECLDRFVKSMEDCVHVHEPLPVIARVVFTGETVAHELINGDPKYWKEAVRATAIAAFGDSVWVEKIKLLTQAKARVREKHSRPGPLVELEKLVHDIRKDDASLLELGRELDGLFRKLPVEYRQGEGAVDPDIPQSMAQLVAQAHALLVKGLKGERPQS
jgi:DNA repair exonuclease SbcCD nuclease subunit